MTELVAELNYWLALGGIALALATLALIAEYAFFSRTYLVPLVRQYALHAVFAMSAVSVVLTLIYSEVFGFIPCGLCWLQRVALYPLPVIMAIGIWKRDVNAALYGIALSVFGGIIALYQHYLQMGGSELVTCPTAGVGADCANRILFEFGFVTFPLLSFFVFAAIGTVLYIYYREAHEGFFVRFVKTLFRF